MQPHNDKPEALRTVDALSYAKLDRQFWDSVVSRRLFTEAPTSRRGPTGRFFTADDLIALDILGELLRIGVMPGIACRVASDLRAALRADPRIQTLHLITMAGADGTTRPEIVRTAPANSKTLWTIHVAKARRAARQAIAEQLARDDDSEI